ncbi:MAG: hypothetical protein KBC95_00265 [Candidatus Peribacteraceae bacterium]|nr:hypothetical protein [Candidatus Peribacteraceae bacterium]
MSNVYFPKDQAKKYNIDGGECYLYPDCPTGRLSCAYVIQDGRYPVQGRKVNKTCTEAMFIIDGEYTMDLGSEILKLKAHDVVYVTPGTPYSMEGKGTSFVFIEPKWDSAQNVATE